MHSSPIMLWVRYGFLLLTSNMSVFTNLKIWPLQNCWWKGTAMQHEYIYGVHILWTFTAFYFCYISHNIFDYCISQFRMQRFNQTLNVISILCCLCIAVGTAHMLMRCFTCGTEKSKTNRFAIQIPTNSKYKHVIHYWHSFLSLFSKWSDCQKWKRSSLFVPLASFLTWIKFNRSIEKLSRP